MIGLLANQQERESSIGKDVGLCYSDTPFSENLPKLFADLNLPVNFAFRRNAAPLSVLSLIYPVTTVYIPPITKPLLETRLGLRLDELVTLWRAGVIVPVIGHPKYYTERHDLVDLLALKPVSAWARFDAAAELFGRGDFVDGALSTIRPLSGEDRTWAQRKWSQQFPHLSSSALDQQILQEVANNYANLALLGLKEVGDEILNGRSANAARLIVAVNEVLVYPRIIGLGGRPSFDDSSLQESAYEGSLWTQPQRERAALERGASHLVQGLRLSAPARLNVDEILRLRDSNDLPRIWALHEQISTSAIQRSGADLERLVGSYGELVQDILSKASSITRRKEQTETIVRWASFGLGVGAGASAYAATASAGFWASLGAASAVGGIPPYLISQFRETMSTLVGSIGFKKHEIDFWQIRSKAK